MILNLPADIEIKTDIPLDKYSSFKIGGCADVAIFPKSISELTRSIEVLRTSGTRFDIIGNGTNILFDDNGYRGALIFTKNMNSTSMCREEDITFITAECGKKLTELAAETIKKHSLAGLEFAYGIPGTVGGAVYMNAGAYGGEMKDIVVESLCYDAEKRTLVTLDATEHEFTYRNSIFAKNKNLTVISAKLKLTDDTDGSAKAKALANMQSRKDKQPLDFPNAGSTFKRPDGYIAAKLIDDCGLKGLSVGGACVSEKHAGFVINKGNATCSDVLNLTDIIKEKIKEHFNVKLELEIIYLPEK
ncbi:MAG: UDP-N-acetylmuramate dehydrogenase [Ruminococcaceae bacterium]|nr:UDP-N-acetylmuramate dehydrogenase [Oscillospiraceae bacterium]